MGSEDLAATKADEVGEGDDEEEEDEDDDDVGEGCCGVDRLLAESVALLAFEFLGKFVTLSSNDVLLSVLTLTTWMSSSFECLFAVGGGGGGG